MKPTATPLSILLVEDNPRHAELIRDELEMEIPGAVVTLAGGVVESREAMAGRRFDVVLLDFRLPDGDGLEILREMRATGRVEPIVFVTTQASASTAVEAMKLGAADYVVKEEGYLAIVPFVVRDVLERARLRREREDLERRLARAEHAATLHKLSAGIAHNLNNPLTTVRTFLELLPSRWESDEEFRHDYYRLVLGETERIRDLVGRMMRTAVLSDPDVVDPWHPGDLLHEIEQWFAPGLAERSLRMECRVDEGLPAMQRGREAVRQALVVLVDNAIAFSPVGGLVSLRARREVEGPTDRLVFAVVDQGPGVPIAERERVFEPFFSTRPGGVGIGLFVARALVRGLGGGLEAKPVEAAGSGFLLELPLDA